MYTIRFRFYGHHSIGVEGIVEACMAWDALASQFGMVSRRPCDGIACDHDPCVANRQEVSARVWSDVAAVIKPEDDETPDEAQAQGLRRTPLL